ncbi:MAG: tRNA ((37)-N6)-threonylcarbamoyltransferase complex ATPase subunit type 1 TsaE [Verrucomicrobiota bacterium]
MALGARFAAKADAGDVIALVGNLGAGKTHWTKGFVAAIDPNAAVTSPTFAILNEYRSGKLPVFHFDFHRLKSAEELLALGWDEYLEESGIVICEWADLFPELMPQQTQWLEIRHLSDGSRELRHHERPA